MLWKTLMRKEPHIQAPGGCSHPGRGEGRQRLTDVRTAEPFREQQDGSYCRRKNGTRSETGHGASHQPSESDISESEEESQTGDTVGINCGLDFQMLLLVAAWPLTYKGPGQSRKMSSRKLQSSE